MTVDDEPYPLHRAAFFNDVHAIRSLVTTNAAIIYEQDLHGNTALHIATMLGHREAISLLLSYNAPVKVRNAEGWHVLIEAASYGDRQIVTDVFRRLKSQRRETYASRKIRIMDLLSTMDDFYIELRWEFQSWIPLLSRVLPGDVCKIWKKGRSIRLDTTLRDLGKKSWERGDISFLWRVDAKRSTDEEIILDNKAKVFQRIRKTETEVELDEEIDMIMSNDLISVQMSTKTVTLSAAQNGWIFKHQREETIGGEFHAIIYEVEGLQMVTRKRREHLSAEDVKRNKSLLAALQSGDVTPLGTRANSRMSLPPPGRPSTTWEDYKGAPPGKPPLLGRVQDVKTSTKTVKAFVAMSESFPLSLTTLIDLLELMAPVKHLQKLRRFCEARLPPGFPVKLEIPLLPTISARVTFEKYERRDDISDKIFTVPASYVEKATHFSNL